MVTGTPWAERQGTAQAGMAHRQAGPGLPPHHSRQRTQDMLRKHRGTDRTEGSRPTRKAQKVTGEKGWFLSRHLTLLLAEEGRCTMKSTRGRCRISSTIRVRKKFELTCHRFKKHHGMRPCHHTPIQGEEQVGAAVPQAG